MSNTFDSVFKYKLIYVFEICDSAHRGLLKIGDATVETNDSIDKLTPNCKILNTAAHARIKQYTNTAGVDYRLLYTEIAVYSTKNSNGKVELKAFRDNSVHRILENSGISKTTIKGTTGREWYKISLNTAKQAIAAVKSGLSNLSNTPADTFIPVELREEQEKAIKDTLAHFKKGNTMLWNAKMRFGKTLTALELVRRSGFMKTIIITHRPVVDAGWYEDFSKIFHGEDYIYGSKNHGYTVEELLKKKTNFVYFASMQDLGGSHAVGGKHNKNDIVFSTAWDCVIVDEAHEGTKTALGEEITNNLVKENTKFLALSGTPFNILREYDDNVFTWDYVMEQRRKKEWAEKHFGDSNPYEDLPELKIYTYDLGKITNYKYIDIEDKAFRFREFFRTWTGDIKYDKKLLPEGVNIGDFYHKEDVWNFLNLISKTSADSNYPYSKDEYRELFKHSLWMVPGVKEARALYNLMMDHPVFRCGQFNIVNVAGNGNEEEESKDALKKVREAIDNAGDGYTITLSCGKLTTGVTIPEWTAVFMLAGSFSTSASSYLQTIFRVQSPCNKNGKTKTCCYVFDFAPDRTLKMVAESVALSTKAGKTTNSDRAIMGEFLNYCSVISIDGTMMKKYDTNRLLQQLKRAYAERAVQNGFDDTNLYNDELLKLNNIDLDKFNKLKGIVGASKAAPKTKDIDMNKQGFTDEEYEELQRIEEKPKKHRTPEEEQKLKEAKEKNKNKQTAISILRGISIRMPLLIYGADIAFDEELTLEKFLDDNIVDPDSWIEFMPKGVTKEFFKDFLKYYDEEIFIAAGRRIRNTLKSADELNPTERAKKIASLFAFFKNPDKETVLTPWRVVNMHMSDCLGGYDFYDEYHSDMIEQPRLVDRGQVTKDVFEKSDAKILEINSKTGLYPLYVAYSSYRYRCKKYKDDELTLEKQNELWAETVKQNIFVICNTKMAKAITKRTLVGYKDIPVNAHYFQDLVNMMKNKPENFVDKVRKADYWKLKGNGKVKFDAIVGNPPYQQNVGVEKENYAVAIYNYFVQSSKKINPNYISMIIPSRWFAGGRGLDEFRDDMLNDRRLISLFDYTNAAECFPTADISGGVCYFLWNKNADDDCIISSVTNGKITSQMKRPLLESNCSTLIRFNEAIPILRKIQSKNEDSFSSIVSPQTPFGLVSSFKDYESKPFDNSIHIYTSNGDGYISRDIINKGQDLIDCDKVYISKSYGERGDYPYFFLGKPFIGERGSCCTQTYLCIGPFNSKQEVNSVISYIKTKFFRFCIMLKRNTQDAMRGVYEFVPMQDFSKSWTDAELYKKYGLTEEEIDFIENMIKPME